MGQRIEMAEWLKETSSLMTHGAASKPFFDEELPFPIDIEETNERISEVFSQHVEKKITMKQVEERLEQIARQTSDRVYAGMLHCFRV
ncbi:MAG TPA: hypothetical protein PLG31_11730 [Spirochaetota bacterium]|nr:hypothetical protein [Spirochaetota bacterium]